MTLIRYVFWTLWCFDRYFRVDCPVSYHSTSLWGCGTVSEPIWDRSIKGLIFIPRPSLSSQQVSFEGQREANLGYFTILFRSKITDNLSEYNWESTCKTMNDYVASKWCIHGYHRTIMDVERRNGLDMYLCPCCFHIPPCTCVREIAFVEGV